MRELAAVLPQVDAEQFFGVDIRVARVLAAEPLPGARRPAYLLRLDLGPLGERTSSAQITNYSIAELVGSTVVCVVNFSPRRIAGVKSEVLVLGAYRDDGAVIVLRPDQDVAPGSVIG